MVEEAAVPMVVEEEVPQALARGGIGLGGLGL